MRLGPHTLFGKYLATIGAAIVIPLLVAISLQAGLSFHETERGIAQLHEAQAQVVATRLETFVSTIADDLAAALRLVRVSERTPPLYRYDAELFRLLRRHPSVTELSLVASSGAELLARARLAEDRIGGGRDWSRSPAFVHADAERYWVEAAYFYRDSEPRTRISVRGPRADDPVLIAEVSLKLLWTLSEQRLDGGTAYVVAQDGSLMAHPNLDWVLRRQTFSTLLGKTGNDGPAALSPVRLETVRRADGEKVVHTRLPLPAIQSVLILEQTWNEAYQPVLRLLQRSTVILAFGALIALLTSALLARRMTKPIRALHEGARRIGEGDLRHRIDDSAGDELGQLASEFNRMAGHLQEDRDLLETRVTARTRDLACEMKRAESLLKELQEKKAEAEQANMAKTRFLAAASHDLRQPMHALGLLVGVLKSRLGQPEAAEIVGSIQATAEGMERLFAALLDISRLDAGIVEPATDDFPLSHILWVIEEEFALLANNKGLQLTVHPTSVWVRSDPQVLERIIRNLVANAIRYTAQGRIVVGCRRRGMGREIALCVYDTGIGIPEEDVPRIFMEFVQLDNAERDRSKGLGLGLSIVKRSAELLGHPLRVLSRVDKGSCFAIDIPRIPHRERRTGATLVEASETELEGAFVAFIDDDREIRAAMGSLFALWGCHAVVAASADQAERELAKHLRQPDLIISDFWLAGGRDGIEAVSALRRSVGVNVPALILTGDITPSDLARIQGCGFRLLHKPINPSRLGEAIRQVIDFGRTAAGSQ